MKKYLQLAKYDFKNIYRDKLTLFLLCYPIIQLLFFSFLIPMILTSVPPQQEMSTEMMLTLIVLVFACLGTVIGGAMLGLNLVESKDDNSIRTISVTPVGIEGYIVYKSVFYYVIGTIGTFIMTYGITFAEYYGLRDVSVINVILYCLVMGLTVPFLGLLIATIAKNKVQAFTALKSVSIVVLVPVLSIMPFFSDYKQYFFGFLPSFWATQALRVSLPYMAPGSYDLSFSMYLIVGTLVSIAIYLLCLKVIKKRLQV